MEIPTSGAGDLRGPCLAKQHPHLAINFHEITYHSSPHAVLPMQASKHNASLIRAAEMFLPSLSEAIKHAYNWPLKSVWRLS